MSLKPGRAFDLFARRFGEWWPLTSNSLAQTRAVSCHLEPRVGGRIFERTAEGAESVWGMITEWSDPGRFVTTWHPSRHPDSAQMLEVRFTPAPGGTMVELEQREWEQAGDRAADLRERYESGWPAVLAKFASKASQEA